MLALLRMLHNPRLAPSKKAKKIGCQIIRLKTLVSTAQTLDFLNNVRLQSISSRIVASPELAMEEMNYYYRLIQNEALSPAKI